jgi:glycosyltransferase involved in cell wall biosynthesis
MKIAYLMQAGVPDLRAYPLSGPANHVKQVFRELVRLHHEVTLLAYLGGRIYKSQDLSNFEPVSIPRLDHGPLRLFERMVRRIQYEARLPYAALFESLRFALACRKELSDCDLLYERMGWMGYGGGLAAKWLRVPLVLEVNGDHLHEMEMLGVAPQGFQLILSKQLTKIAASQASCIVATGEGWRQTLIARWGIEPAKVVVVENGSEFVNLLHREQLSSFKAGETESQPITIIYVGGLEPWHGIPVLIRAAGQVIAHGLSLHVVIAGNGTEFNRSKQLIHEMDLEAQVTLTGPLAASQLAFYLSGSDIAVSPYCGRAEFSGLKLLDYKAAGLATIASGGNGQPTVLKHGHTGWIVPPGDEEALCEAIIHLASDSRLRKQIGRAARIEAEQFHTWQHTAGQLNQVFKRLVGNDSSNRQFPIALERSAQ